MSSVSTINVEQFKDQMFFAISLHRWGGRAKVTDATALREYLRQKQEGDSSPEAARPINGNGKPLAVDKVSSTKQLLDMPELDAINEFLTDVKDKLVGKIRGRANPSFIREGLFTVRKGLVPVFESELKDAVRKIQNELRPAIEKAYEDAIKRAETLPVSKGGLGPLFNRADYPPASEVAAKFSIDWQYLALGVPDDLPAELRAEKEAQFQKQLQDAAEEIKQALRVGFGEFISHAVEKLTVAPGEKPKIFRDSLLTNLDEFISSFESRNMGDPALEDLIAKARNVIRPNGGDLVDPDRLRKFANVRDGFATKFAEIKAQLEPITRASRKIDLSDE